ncbi:MAG: hypothetical protein ACREXR_09020 [Gammaproteobacteria bacterium]
MNRLDRANRRAAWRLAFASLAMFAFGYALVPLYDAFCEVTGLGRKIPGQAALEGPPTVTLPYTFFRAPEKDYAGSGP